LGVRDGHLMMIRGHRQLGASSRAHVGHDGCKRDN
jgi:hypothetical protein